MKTNKSVGLIASATLALLAAGCNSVDQDIKGAKQSIETPEIEHNWQEGKCASIGSLKLVGMSNRTTYAFSGNNVTKTVQIYSSADCVDASIAVSYMGTFATHGVIQPGVRPIDFTYGSVVVTAQGTAGVNTLNAVNFCGDNAWVLNMPADLSAKTRDATCPLSALPDASYDIYTVQNDMLYFGQGDGASNVDDRATVMDMSHGYRQL